MTTRRFLQKYKVCLFCWRANLNFVVICRHLIWKFMFRMLFGWSTSQQQLRSSSGNQSFDPETGASSSSSISSSISSRSSSCLKTFADDPHWSWFWWWEREAIGCDDMVVNSLFIVLWQVVPMGGGGREGGRLFEDINPGHTAAHSLHTELWLCWHDKTYTKDMETEWRDYFIHLFKLLILPLNNYYLKKKKKQISDPLPSQVSQTSKAKTKAMDKSKELFHS